MSLKTKEDFFMANQAVYGIVANRAKAETLIQALIDAGVNPQDISFLSSQEKEFHEFHKSSFDTEASRNWRTEGRVKDYPTDTKTSDWKKDTTQPNQSKSAWMGTEKHTKAPEGTTTGALTGGLIGGALGLLAGIGAVAIPGIGPFIAAGPLMATLAGIGAGGTLGGVAGALIGAGIPEFEAKRYENRLKEGGILFSVHANNDNLAKRIKDILQKHNVEDVSISSEATSSKNYKK